MIDKILDLPMELVYWLSGQVRSFIASLQSSKPASDERAASTQQAAPTSETTLLDWPMVAIYRLSGWLRSHLTRKQNRTTPRKEGGNPLRFRTDLWERDEGDGKMAMDVRPTVIVLPKPWMGLFSLSARHAAHISLIELLFLRVEIHTDSKRLVYSTSWFWDRAGQMWVIELVDIQLPEKVDLEGVVWSEMVLDLTVVKFTVRGSDKERRLLLPRRGMWWPTSLQRPREKRISAGPGYALMLKSLASWASNGKWT